jgi:hypothetical protein
MASIGKIWTALFLSVVLWAECGRAQTLPQTSQDALQAMTDLAGVIFAGQVVAVRQHGAAGSASGVVEIEFAVEDAVRGVSGGSYTVREWAGLWPGGDTPFRVGQRYLMLLHSPGAGGLSSPVGGMDGAIPIRGGGPTVGPADGSGGDGLAGGAFKAIAAIRIAPQTNSAQLDGRVVDLDWVGTSVVRPTSYRQAGGAIARPIMLQSGSASVVSSDTANGGAAIAPIEKLSASAQQGTAYASVLGMLRNWEKNGPGAR